MTRLPIVPLTLILMLLAPAPGQTHVVRLNVETREVVLGGRSFGAAGPYEKLIGTVDFALDPDLPQNLAIVDLALVPRNAQGLIEFRADFYLLKPVDPRRGNGKLLNEVGNRGGKRILPVFQRAEGSLDPTTDAEFGDASLMREGWTLVWLGWQWDVPEGRMRMEMPIATGDGRPITGLVRGNFIAGHGWTTAPVADRGHLAYTPVDPDSPDHVMTVRDLPTDPPEVVERGRWRFVDGQTVALDDGFEPGRIYDVVYLAQDPRVTGTGLAGTRDIVSFLKYATEADGNPMPGIRLAFGWGVSQSGRFLRHFLYQGFNEDERGRQVYDGVFDQMGGAGRGSFNHRFAQASRDALQHFNIFFPVDMFPFTNGTQTDPVTGATDGLLARAERAGVTPKIVHLAVNSDYFHRGASLVHTDVTGTRDVEPPDDTRIYVVASAPHAGAGTFPPAPATDDNMATQAPRSLLEYSTVVRALFRALDRWVDEDAAPPPSQYPRLGDGTLVEPARSGWPAVPGVDFPTALQTPSRLDFGPEWNRGIVSHEPPAVGAPFVPRVPAVDADGHDRAGIRLPEVEVPLATLTGWNYRHPRVGAPDRLAGETGAYFPLAKTRAERRRTRDPRLSIEERYEGRADYLGRIAAATLDLVDRGYLLREDVEEIVRRAERHWDWLMGDTASSTRR